MSKRAVLTTLWWTWGLLLFLLLIVLSVQPKLFGDDMTKVWQWFLPNIVPTMTMVGFTAYLAPPPQQSPHTGLFAMALAVSVVYLTVLSAAVLGTMFVPRPLDFVTMFSVFLAPVQGFATAGLALFFIKK